MGVRALVPLCAAIALSAVGAARADFQQFPPFKSGINLLEVDARVFDREGHFVTDLSVEDFDILEDGVPQKIQTMFLVNDRAATGLAAKSTMPRAPQTWILVFDQQHLNMGGYVRARRAVGAFLANRFRPGDLVGIVSDDKMMNRRISSVPSEYLAALKKVMAPFDAMSRVADAAEAELPYGDDEAGVTMAELLRGRSTINARSALDATLRTLDALARGLASIPGPKTIVLMSDGFGDQDRLNTLRTIVDRMNRAGARIYALDTRGLAGGPSDFMNSLAVDTGGRTLFNENNFGRALDAVAADTNVYYVLGYQPTNTKYDGKPRRIEVKVKRPEVTVRARSGYLAIPPQKMNVPKPVK